ncbi:MAG: hypothetical protein P4L33_01520 [Capsulimonadaceae bacterium]|nr:hypothetical protein [Capsulimonadaceae bacterium]
MSMYDCPICQSVMEETVVFHTVCCGAPVTEDSCDVCPVCGEEDPQLEDEEVQLVCLNCGHAEA